MAFNRSLFLESPGKGVLYDEHNNNIIISPVTPGDKVTGERANAPDRGVKDALLALDDWMGENGLYKTDDVDQVVEGFLSFNNTQNAGIKSNDQASSNAEAFSIGSTAGSFFRRLTHYVNQTIEAKIDPSFGLTFLDSSKNPSIENDIMATFARDTSGENFVIAADGDLISSSGLQVGGILKGTGNILKIFSNNVFFSDDDSLTLGNTKIRSSVLETTSGSLILKAFVNGIDLQPELANDDKLTIFHDNTNNPRVIQFLGQSGSAPTSFRFVPTNATGFDTEFLDLDRSGANGIILKAFGISDSKLFLNDTGIFAQKGGNGSLGVASLLLSGNIIKSTVGSMIVEGSPGSDDGILLKPDDDVTQWIEVKRQDGDEMSLINNATIMSLFPNDAGNNRIRIQESSDSILMFAHNGTIVKNLFFGDSTDSVLADVTGSVRAKFSTGSGGTLGWIGLKTVLSAPTVTDGLEGDAAVLVNSDKLYVKFSSGWKSVTLA